MKPSVSLVVSTAFLGFILYSIYNIIILYRAPTCAAGEICYASLLNEKPQLDLYVFTSESPRGQDEKLVLHKSKFDYHEQLTVDLQLDISRKVRNNGTLYAQLVIVPSRKGSSSATLGELKRAADAVHSHYALTQYSIPKSLAFNLLKSNQKQDTKDLKPRSHLKSKFSIVMIDQEFSIPHANIPVELLRFLRINSRERFLPIVYEDIMQDRMAHLEEIARGVDNMTLHFTYNPCSVGKFKMMIQMEATFTHFMQIGFTQKDMDEIKSIYADTNLYLLCLTMFVASVHLLLDFLSFKNDVNFWRANTSMAGLSSRTVIWRVFSQTVVFFYLLDEGTSMLIIIPSGIGTLIEYWKLTKVYHVQIMNFRKGKQSPNRRLETKEEALTRQYDKESMRYLSYALYPLCILGAVYSLLYQPHKSWYSWTINSLVNGVYVFGFLFMLPQLFVNYRLKSVAALPWRAFTYKAFNTFIDDIFAFIITMPTTHRIACFRDDIVFIIYLYQRWLYPVDKTRRDEGASGEAVESSLEKKEQ